jgi:hypothetical protein
MSESTGTKDRDYHCFQKVLYLFCECAQMKICSSVKMQYRLDEYFKKTLQLQKNLFFERGAYVIIVEIIYIHTETCTRTDFMTYINMHRVKSLYTRNCMMYT